MKPKSHLVLEMCIKQGIDWGWTRAHKHFVNPPENILKEEIENAISHEIYEWFDMENESMRNRIRCRKCGDIIESKTRHDYVTCKCGAVAVDGGSSYMSALGNPADMEELEEWPKDPKDMCGNE
jgi:hypothetical protein